MTTALKPDVSVMILSHLGSHSRLDAVWIARCFLPNLGDMDDGELGDWLAAKGLIDA